MSSQGDGAAAADDHHVADNSAGVEQHFIKAELGEMTEVESMCPKCEENGMTRLMFIKVPHFRELVVSSFTCGHCTEQNRSIQFGGEYGPKKVEFHLEVNDVRDLNRQVVKADYATISIPELELELGPDAQKGSLNTVEGILQQVKDGLEFQQNVRKITDPELHDKIEAFIVRLEQYKSLEKPFNLWLDDPSGNSYIEAIHHEGLGHVDRQLTRFEVTRTPAERQQIGLATDESYNPTRTAEEEAQVDSGKVTSADRITEFLEACPACAKEGTVKVHETVIPHFGHIVIMAFKCDVCGYKSNDIKSAGEIPVLGRRIKLDVLNKSDLCRDVLKSDSTKVLIPEIDLEMAPGTLGGFFTTVEGVLNQVHEALYSMKQTSFEEGDSDHLHTSTAGPATMKGFLAKLATLRDGEAFPFTLILEDPLGMIYVQNPRAHLKAPNNEDPQLKVEDYERTEEEKEDLGL